MFDGKCIPFCQVQDGLAVHRAELNLQNLKIWNSYERQPDEGTISAAKLIFDSVDKEEFF